MERIATAVDYKCFTISGTVVSGDTSGDGSIPGGVQYLAPYVDDLIVTIYGDFDLVEYLSEDWQRNFCSLLVAAVE